MRVIRFNKFGPPEVLAFEDVPVPEPATGEALVQVKAAALNPSDLKNVAGKFKDTTLPRTPGRDFAGVVKGGKREGEEVWGSPPKLGSVRDGAHAEYVVVPEEALAIKPKRLAMPQAAAIGVPYVTAWASLVRAAQIEAGETILIVGAAGAVGRAATQIAKWKGAKVIGSARSTDPLLGVDHVIDSDHEDLSARVFELTSGVGADAAFDTVGGPLFEPALRSLKVGGRHIAITSIGDGRVSFNLVDFYHRQLHLIGVDSNGLSLRDVAQIADELAVGFESGALIPPEIETVLFSDAIQAYQQVAAGDARTKLVLTF